MEAEYIDAMREHLATLGEELDQLHRAVVEPDGLNSLLYRAAERNLQLLTGGIPIDSPRPARARAVDGETEAEAA